MFGKLSVFALALAICACGNKAAAVAADDEELKVDSIGMEVNDEAIVVSYEIDYPVAGNAVLVDSLRSFIASYIGGDISLLSDGNALVKDVFQETCSALKSEREEVMASMEVTSYLPYEHVCQVRLQTQTDAYVTYSHIIYEFEGGAHGMSYDASTTFSKADGRQLGWNLLKDTDSSAFRGLLVKGLLEYFEVESEGELDEALLVEGGGRSLPLPASEPWLTEKGMTFCYQLYEIAPYACGMPTVVLTYEQLQPFLSDEAKSLLKL